MPFLLAVSVQKSVTTMELKIELDEKTLDVLAQKISASIAPQRKLAYTTEELANELGTYPQKISMWRREGLIAGLRLGNGWIYRAEEVERFLRQYEGTEIGTTEKCRKEKK